MILWLIKIRITQPTEVEIYRACPLYSYHDYIYKRVFQLDICMYTHKRGVKNLFLSYCQSPYKYFFGIFKMQENWDFWKVALIGTGHFFETFRAEIYACFGVLFFAHVDIPTSARYRVMVVWLLYRKENRFHISVFCKFHQYYVYTTTHVLFFDFTCLFLCWCRHCTF